MNENKYKPKRQPGAIKVSNKLISTPFSAAQSHRRGLQLINPFCRLD